MPAAPIQSLRAQGPEWDSALIGAPISPCSLGGAMARTKRNDPPQCGQRIGSGGRTLIGASVALEHLDVIKRSLPTEEESLVASA